MKMDKQFVSPSSKVLVHICCLFVSFRISAAQSNKTLAECTFENAVECGFVIIPDLEGIHHTELWTLSLNLNVVNRIGQNGPSTDHTRSDQLDVFAYTKSLETTAPENFMSFTTTISSPDLNFTSGLSHISFYYYLWITDDPEGHADTYATLSVKGCNNDLMWSKQAFTRGWQFAEVDFACRHSGRIAFEALHSQPGSGVAIDDVTITEASVDIRPDFATYLPAMPSTPSPNWPGNHGNTTNIPISRDSGGTHNHGGGIEGRMLVVAVGCFLGTVLIFAVSITIHCYFYRKRKRTNSQMTANNNGMHVSNTGYDFLTGIAGINNGHGTTRTMATETTTLSSTSRGLGGSSYQMDLISEKGDAGSGTINKPVDDIPLFPRGKRRSLTLPSFKRSFGSRDRSFDYSEIPETSPTDGNVYSFMTTPRGSKDKAPKLGTIGRSTAMVRSNSLPSRKSFESNKPEGPYHVTDLIGNITIDWAPFPSMESLASSTMKKKYATNDGEYDHAKSLHSSRDKLIESERPYKAIEMRKEPQGYDVVHDSGSPGVALVCRESSNASSHIYRQLEMPSEQSHYDVLDPVTMETGRAPRDLTEYEYPPLPVSPKPMSIFAPRPMSPRQRSPLPSLPSVVPRETMSSQDPGKDGFAFVTTPSYFTLVPDLVRDASYDYPSMPFTNGGECPEDTADACSDLESNPYESFDRPITPNSRKNSRQDSNLSKKMSIDTECNGNEKLVLKTNNSALHTLVKKQQLAKFLDDDYENIQ